MNLIYLKDIIPCTDNPEIIDGKILNIKVGRDVNWVFRYNNSLYRLIINSEIQDGRWNKIQEFMNTNEFKELMNKGFVPRYELTDMKLENFLNGDIYKIVDEVYCMSGSFRTISQELDCLRLICKISLLLEEMKSPYFLTDVNSWNFGFNYSKPVYIDIGSFSTSCKNMLEKHIQCMLNKFNLVFKNDWNLLLNEIDDVPIELNRGEWADYSNASHLKYESNIVFNWLQSDNSIKSIIDVGCCAGEFSNLFSSKGYNVIAIDRDEYVLHKLYKNSNDMNIFCLKLDPGKNYEIEPNSDDLQELYNFRLEKNWVNEIKGDVVFCSSIMHHLYKDGVNFKTQSLLWNKICSKYLIIEYIDRNDYFVKKWKDIPDYNIDNFLESMSDKWELLDEKPSEYKNRNWYFFKKR